MKTPTLAILALVAAAGVIALLPNIDDGASESPVLAPESKKTVGPVVPSLNDGQPEVINRAGFPEGNPTEGIEAPTAAIPWWENKDLIESLRTSFMNEVGNYDNGWEEMYDIAENHLQKGVECPGILLEYVRLTMDDFLDLSPAQMACSRGVLTKIGSNRMELGADPFGEREQDIMAQTRLEEKILADGLAYGPEYMLDALTYRSGDVHWTDEERREFAAIRLDFLLDLIPIQAELDNRRNAAANFLAKRIPDALIESGFLPGLNTLDPQRAILESKLQDLNIRYLEKSRRFVWQ
jgi:hypothetical protein